jgi:hypothetical protein
LRAASSSRPTFRSQPPALLLLYCSFNAALLLLYCCFTAVLLLCYLGFTGQHSADTHSAAGGGVHHQLPRRLPQVYLLLLYCCFTADLLLTCCCGSPTSPAPTSAASTTVRNVLALLVHKYKYTSTNTDADGGGIGYNCAESCNFATEYWIPFGVQAKPCACAAAKDSGAAPAYTR